MFISILPPFSAYYQKAPYHWIFHKQIRDIPNEKISYILTPDYLEFRDQYFLKEYFLKISSISKYLINEVAFSKFTEKSHLIWETLKLDRDLQLEEYFKELIQEISQKNEVEAILLWNDFPSVEKIAEELNIPVIHNELGPFREPVYRMTGYFDFKGLHLKSEFRDRLEKFSKEINDLPQDLIWQSEDLLKLLVMPNFLENIERECEITPLYDIGVALQAEDPRVNRRGLTNHLFLQKIYKTFGKNVKLLSRLHPEDLTSYSEEELGVKDNSDFAYKFICNCRQIMTLNSNVAIEALLYNKSIYFEEFHQVDFFNSNKKQSLDCDTPKEVALNFLIFCYLVPYELIYDLKYYRWRLNKPTEREIFDYHQQFYTKKFILDYGKSIKELFVQADQLNNEIEELKIQKNNLRLEIEAIKNSHWWKYSKMIRKLERSIKKRL